jgi:hypothetical protein
MKNVSSEDGTLPEAHPFSEKGVGSINGEAFQGMMRTIVFSEKGRQAR